MVAPPPAIHKHSPAEAFPEILGGEGERGGRWNFTRRSINAYARRPQKPTAGRLVCLAMGRSFCQTANPVDRSVSKSWNV